MTTPIQPGDFSLPRAALVIGGKILTEASGGVHAHVNPATGLAQGAAPLAGAAEVDAAVAAANAALPGWKSTPPATRRDLLFRLADLVERDTEIFAHIGALEIGTPVAAVRMIPPKFVAWTKYAAGWADKLEGRVVSTFQDDSVFDFTLNEPYGVIGMILTWNGPLMALAMKIGPALATGNTVVIKPPELSPFTATHFMTLVAEAGIPDGVVNLVTGAGTAGDALVRHPGVHKVAFTGGPVTAAKIAATIAPLHKPAIYELGGKSANIVMEDADLDLAVRHSARTPLTLSGQGCVLPTRLLVQRGVAEEMAERVMAEIRTMRLGDPLDEATELGPVATEGAQTRLFGLIEAARQRGDGKLAMGGGRPDGFTDGWFVAPTVFHDVDPDSSLAQDECFGPVVSIIPFDDDTEALRIANSTPYGLGAYMHGRDITRLLRLAHELEAGSIQINGAPTARENAPFGGLGLSGYGREGGRDGLQEFIRTKNVAVQKI